MKDLPVQVLVGFLAAELWHQLYVLLAREEFHANESHYLRWSGPRRIFNCLSDWIYQVQDLRTGKVSEKQISRLKQYHNV